ncbi:rod shape-determining protein RodA [Thermopolyspora sp. NPDC052614]|uniref:rod shape-determining protein RodA n=1 Tax=Thermopolyspora sp. NPDC052614 TaxID=3155682 RepID=UPI0034391940
MTRAVAAQRRSLTGRALEVRSAVRQMDGALLISVALLSVFGALLVWSSTRTWAAGAPTGLINKHLLNLAIGWVLFGAVAMADARKLRSYAPLAYLAGVAGLVAVITPLGATVNGSHSWILLGGGFAFQPSEMAKPALILMLAMLLGRPVEGTDRPRGLDVLLSLVATSIPITLVLLQPDLGTTMVFCVIVVGVLVFSGLRKRWIALFTLVAAVGAVLVWSMDVLKPYQVERFTAFVDPSRDPRGAGYNSTQSLIAIGSGEVFGKGLFRGGQTMGRFVPEQHTDFIFTVAGEEFGFVGSIAVVILLGVVLLRGLRIARQCEDRFGMMVAAGIVCWLAFQTFINIGMTIGIMPITGLPLPFVSYGGTATFANMIAIGVLQAIHIRVRSFR